MLVRFSNCELDTVRRELRRGAAVVHAQPPDSNGIGRGVSLPVSAAKGVLANDSDPDIHDHLTVGAVDGTAANVGHAINGTYGSLTSTRSAVISTRQIKAHCLRK
jgi:hypothetical protein